MQTKRDLSEIGSAELGYRVIPNHAHLVQSDFHFFLSLQNCHNRKDSLEVYSCQVPKRWNYEAASNMENIGKEKQRIYYWINL